MAALIPLGTVACATPEGERQAAIAKAKAHCEAEGKQFILRNVEQSGVINWTDYYTTVAGNCVGPGEPGYVPPSSK